MSCALPVTLADTQEGSVCCRRDFQSPTPTPHNQVNQESQRDAGCIPSVPTGSPFHSCCQSWEQWSGWGEGLWASGETPPTLTLFQNDIMPVATPVLPQTNNKQASRLGCHQQESHDRLSLTEALSASAIPEVLEGHPCLQRETQSLWRLWVQNAKYQQCFSYMAHLKGY